MNQIDIGRFIATCRKEKQLTQAQLAEKLNITDRAVSKWETGKSMPDASIMLELCNILGITVNELLSGERIRMEDYSKKVDENLVELKRKNENSIKVNVIIADIITILFLTGIFTCIICDLRTAGGITWSMITTSSILFTWMIVIPLIIATKRRILKSLVSLSILIIPFLYVLSVIIKVKAIFSIGAAMTVVGILYLWSLWGIHYKFSARTNKMLATGLSILLAIPFNIIANVILAIMLAEPMFDMWDGLAAFLLLITGIPFIVYDRMSVRRGRGRTVTDLAESNEKA